MHVAKIMGRNAPLKAMLLILATITCNTGAVAKLGVRGTPVTHPPALPPYRKVQYWTPCIQVLVKPMERCVCKSLRVPWAASEWVQFSLSSAHDAWVLSLYQGLPQMWPAGCY